MTQDMLAYRDAGPALMACDDDEVQGISVTAEPALPPPMPSLSSTPALTGRDRTDALLAALTEMAALSLRRQADVAVAVRRAGLSLSREAVAAALEQLGRDGCIGPPLYLSDVGILVAVTVRGIEHLATTAHRHIAARFGLSRRLRVPVSRGAESG